MGLLFWSHPRLRTCGELGHVWTLEVGEQDFQEVSPELLDLDTRLGRHRRGGQHCIGN